MTPPISASYKLPRDFLDFAITRPRHLDASVPDTAAAARSPVSGASTLNDDNDDVDDVDDVDSVSTSCPGRRSADTRRVVSSQRPIVHNLLSGC